MATWNDLRLAVRVSPSRERMNVGEIELDTFETRHGFKLPASYRSFAKEFGRGELTATMGDGSWMIAVPGVVAEDDYLDLDRLIGEMSGVVEMDAGGIPGQEPRDRELAPRMIFFAKDVRGDFYGWDRGEVTEASGPDYAIYARTPTYERVASSFEEFLLSYALGEDLARWSEAGEPGEGTKFEPDEDPRIFLDPM
jgi:hypothetical protein